MIHLFRHDHRFALELGIARQGQFGSAAGRDHGRAGGAHFPQFLQPPHVALAPRGDAAFEPVRFQLQPRVHPLRCAGFLGIDRLFPRLIAAEADILAAHVPPVEPQRRAGQALQKGAVMADDHEGAFEPVEPALQPVDGGQVEMVGRLVQQQQVRLLRQRAGDGGAAALAAAGGGCVGGHVDTELAGDGFHRMFGRRAVARQGIIHQRLAPGEVGFLLQPYHVGIGLDLAHPAIRLRFRPVMSRSSVVLPTPLRPISAIRSRGPICRSSPSPLAGSPSSQRPPCCRPMPSSERIGGSAMSAAQVGVALGWLASEGWPGILPMPVRFCFSAAETAEVGEGAEGAIAPKAQECSVFFSREGAKTRRKITPLRVFTLRLRAFA